MIQFHLHKIAINSQITHDSKERSTNQKKVTYCGNENLCKKSKYRPLPWNIVNDKK